MDTERDDVILIAAMSETRVIGRCGALPWRIPEEYEHFLSCVRGRPVVIGRTSHEIFGGDLGDARVVVVSRSREPRPGLDVRPGVPEAIERARALGRPVFVAGGASVYRQALPLADALYLSTVKGTYEGDAYFPDFEREDWPVASCENRGAYTFRVHRRAGRP